MLQALYILLQQLVNSVCVRTFIGFHLNAAFTQLVHICWLGSTLRPVQLFGKKKGNEKTSRYSPLRIESQHCSLSKSQTQPGLVSAARPNRDNPAMGLLL